ncbi:LamB/YcsF family protein [Falsirhodobacter algicola]|uniref:5-oxoprolinase subunit A n=1 Tax=Falsirhodobacter algicola TaxID=2692330 RepID=A0A8J8MV86_9RHOB|nr:5-oxoprolinase subunit PxpA [Falsirhodobacter algicola]QUS37320.1 5-oxoprolinase subunit PxpA [Falsirhodobacter algicola]
MRTIDLNCDMGEGFGAWSIGDDAAMLDIATTANIACGFHAGDPVVMRRTIGLARERGVAIGAHPSFADLPGFGRRRITGERPEDLETQIIYQILSLGALARLDGHPLTHVKLHGALSNMAAEDAALAETCVRAVRAADPGLIFVALPYSESWTAAERAGLTLACEVFADRTYAPDGRLMPRSAPGSVIHDAAQSCEHVLEMVVNRRIPTVGGAPLEVEPDTICVHGDTPGAVTMARLLRRALEAEGVSLAPFARR